jgi:glycosyltransferase involved in cell wall biosynthesis
VSLTPERRLRVLLTNRVLAHRTGTEVYVRDLAVALLERGHLPIVYSTHLGPLAAEIRSATIPVVSDVSAIGEPPDIIHGHHGLETLAALLAFPAAPAINVCHSWVGWADEPVRFPRVLRNIVVDHTTRDRLIFENGVPAGRVVVKLNPVDLDSFRPRGPLPSRPGRALVFSNSASARAPFYTAIAEVCASAGIALDVAGSASGNALARPQDALGDYDLVFAKGRAALEAAAVGAAVVLCDVAGAGPMVTSGNFRELRPLNFGMRALRSPATVPVLARELARYDASDAAVVSRLVRESSAHAAFVDEMIELYEDVIAEHASTVPDPAADQRAAALYLQRLPPRLHERDLLRAAFSQLLRLPVVGRLMRHRAGRERNNHWFPELIRSLDRD